MSIIDTRWTGKAACNLLLFALVLSGCAVAPYQAMSDARQAIDSAEPMVTPGAAPAATLERARQRLDEAESDLEAGRYGEAQANAADAKELAIEAREQADEDAGRSR
jgi:hypothetical protein